MTPSDLSRLEDIEKRQHWAACWHREDSQRNLQDHENIGWLLEQVKQLRAERDEARREVISSDAGRDSAMDMYVAMKAERDALQARMEELADENIELVQSIGPSSVTEKILEARRGQNAAMRAEKRLRIELDETRTERDALRARVEELERAGGELLDSVDAREERPDCWCTSSGNEEPPGSADIICGACLMRRALSRPTAEAPGGEG
jgi:hypothetical protein